jgi:hypothetical protein
MKNIPGFLFVAFFLVAGIVSCIGAHRKWKWLVDPPDKMWSWYSQAFIKKVFGTRFTVGFTYFLGILFIVFALLGFMNSLGSNAAK